MCRQNFNNQPTQQPRFAVHMQPPQSTAHQPVSHFMAQASCLLADCTGYGHHVAASIYPVVVAAVVVAAAACCALVLEKNSDPAASLTEPPRLLCAPQLGTQLLAQPLPGCKLGAAVISLRSSLCCGVRGSDSNKSILLLTIVCCLC